MRFLTVLSFISVICAPTGGLGQDGPLDDLLANLDGDAASITALNQTLEMGTEEQLQVLYRRIADIADDRPDLVDRIISSGLASGNDVLRHQSLWLLLKRSKMVTCRIDFDKSASDEGRIRNSIGGVISIPLYEVDDARRSIHLSTTPRGEGENRHLSLIGGNVNMRTYGDRWRFSGVFSLNENGTMLSGPADYYDNGNTRNLFCDIDLT